MKSLFKRKMRKERQRTTCRGFDNYREDAYYGDEDYEDSDEYYEDDEDSDGYYEDDGDSDKYYEDEEAGYYEEEDSDEYYGDRRRRGVLRRRIRWI